MLVGQAVEAAGAHHGDAVGLGDAVELRRHPGGLAHHHQPPWLAFLVVERQTLSGLPHSSHEMSGVGEALRMVADESVVADRLHRDALGAPGFGQQFAEIVVGLLGLVVTVAPDQSVKDLADRQRHRILSDDRLDFGEEVEALLTRSPVLDKAARAHHAPSVPVSWLGGRVSSHRDAGSVESVIAVLGR